MKGVPKDLDHRGVEALHDILDYNPQSGIWLWKVRRSWRIRAGMQAGSLNQDGHRQIEINGKPFLASRLAWFYMTGEWPPQEIDHVDPNRPFDDSWQNLRLATHKQNCYNRRLRMDSKTGFKGVTIVGKKFRARIGHSYLGLFETAEEAYTAYCEAAGLQYKEFACIK